MSGRRRLCYAVGMTVEFVRTHPGAVVPSYAHPGDAGMDVSACESAVLQPGERKRIRTGLVVALPPGTEAQMRPRSGLARRHGVTLLNTPGTVDEGYRGEIGVILINHGDTPFEITAGCDRADAVIALARAEVEVANWRDRARTAYCLTRMDGAFRRVLLRRRLMRPAASLNGA